MCRLPGCRLPHVDRAGQIRQYANPESTNPSRSLLAHDGDTDESDVSSQEPDATDSDDIDSDGLADDLHLVTNSGFLSQQDDYVQF